MNIGLLFWILMILAVIFGVWASWPTSGPFNFAPVGMNLLVFVLLALLGWKVFGPALKA